MEQKNTEGVLVLGDTNSFKTSMEKNRNISIKRRVELIKKNQYKLKLASGNSQPSQEKPSDSSICSRLESNNVEKVCSFEEI